MTKKSPDLTFGDPIRRQTATDSGTGSQKGGPGEGEGARAEGGIKPATEGETPAARGVFLRSDFRKMDFGKVIIITNFRNFKKHGASAPFSTFPTPSWAIECPCNPGSTGSGFHLAHDRSCDRESSISSPCSG